jgi:hypothetical protein
VGEWESGGGGEWGTERGNKWIFIMKKVYVSN